MNSHNFNDNRSFFQGHFLKNISPSRGPGELTAAAEGRGRGPGPGPAQARPEPGPGPARARPGPGPGPVRSGPGLTRAQAGPEQAFKNCENWLKRVPGGSVWAETLSK